MEYARLVCAMTLVDDVSSQTDESWNRIIDLGLFFFPRRSVMKLSNRRDILEICISGKTFPFHRGAC